jgi:hypothetical protein
MGLDMYAFRHKGERIKPAEDRDALKGTEREPHEFAYWRKHNRLQGFMENLYNKRHDGQELEWNSFNCVPLYLEKDDLDKLEAAINDRKLPATEWFFYGSDSYTWEGEQDDIKATDLKFVSDARKYLLRGYKVFYECWW